MDKTNNFEETYKPIIVLVAICLVITLALALTYGVSNPIIERNSKKAADEARMELMKDADSFDQYTGKLDQLEENKIFVKEVYVAKNKCGIVETVQTNSFGGALEMMVGIDKDGKVTGVKITDHADTPGVGTKNWDGENRNHFYDGLTELKSQNIKDGQVKYVSGASVTGAALHKGVYVALQQFKDMGGVK